MPTFDRNIGSREIAILLAVSDAGSVRKAAMRLGMTPAGVSKTVRYAEAQLGGAVFDRSPGGMVPTLAGQRLLAAGREVLRQMAAAQDTFRHDLGGPSGRLRIGAGPFVAGSLATRLIPEARRRWPDLQIGMTLGSADVLLRDLERGLLDLALCHLEDVNVPNNCSSRCIQTLQSVILARPGHPLSGHASVAWPDIAPYALAGFDQPYSRFLRWYREQVGVDARIAIMLPDFDLLAQSMLDSDLLLFASVGIGTALCTAHGLVKLGMTGPRFVHQVYCVVPDGAPRRSAAAILGLIDETVCFAEP